jgi:hypothetical protein
MDQNSVGLELSKTSMTGGSETRRTTLEDSCRDYAWLITNSAPYHVACEQYQQEHVLHPLIPAVAHVYATDPGLCDLGGHHRQPSERHERYHSRGYRDLTPPWQWHSAALSCKSELARIHLHHHFGHFIEVRTV